MFLFRQLFQRLLLQRLKNPKEAALNCYLLSASVYLRLHSSSTSEDNFYHPELYPKRLLFGLSSFIDELKETPINQSVDIWSLNVLQLPLLNFLLSLLFNFEISEVYNIRNIVTNYCTYDDHFRLLFVSSFDAQNFLPTARGIYPDKVELLHLQKDYIRK